MDHRTSHRAATLIAAVTLLVGCSGDPAAPRSGSGSADAPPSSASGSAPTDVVTGLDAPWSMAIDDDVRLVSERDSGRVLEAVSYTHLTLPTNREV